MQIPPSRSPYLPTLRSTFVTRFIATTIDSAIRISIPTPLCLWHLDRRYFISEERYGFPGFRH